MTDGNQPSPDGAAAGVVHVTYTAKPRKPRPMKLAINGHKVGTLGKDESYAEAVASGPVTVEARLGFGRRNVEFDLPAGQRADVVFHLESALMTSLSATLEGIRPLES